MVYGGKVLSSTKEKFEVVANDLWAFNIPNNSWVEIIENKFKPRFNHQIITNQNEIIIFGGEDKEGFLDGEVSFYKVNRDIWVDSF